MSALINFDFFVIGYLYAAIAYIATIFAVGLYESLARCSSVNNKVDDEFYNQIKDLFNSASPVSNYSIDLNDCLEDITTNIIHDSEHFLLPSDIFEDAVFEAVNDLIDEFAQAPDRFLTSRHTQRLDDIAHAYLNS